jgi:hypothetical protein
MIIPPTWRHCCDMLFVSQPKRNDILSLVSHCYASETGLPRFNRISPTSRKFTQILNTSLSGLYSKGPCLSFHHITPVCPPQGSGYPRGFKLAINYDLKISHRGPYARLLPRAVLTTPSNCVGQSFQRFSSQRAPTKYCCSCFFSIFESPFLLTV